MELLMPSEIARLVFGYLKEEGCNSAAQLFLETSTRLEECRAFIARGRCFKTRICDMSLTDILEKYCMASNIVHEKISQLDNTISIRRSTDLVDQLRFLLEGSRSQRFVVNINVPPQSNIQSGDSPILSGSFRKRRHSNTERDRHKRTKVIQQDKVSDQNQVSSHYIDNTEATPLESLPGHSWNKDELSKSPLKELQKNICGPSENTDCIQSIESTSNISKPLNSINSEGNLKEKEAKKDETAKCTMATSTEELLTFTNMEVQTLPCDINEPSESEWNDEPIENLSLLTKELLVRPELQERIAENINKVIYTSKEDSLCDASLTEANISLMAELSNAIKSTVEATESDPVFEQFLSEVIGKMEETDTSPDEDCDLNKNLNTFDKEQNSNSLPSLTEKHNEVENALHEQNTAAVMSIINANMTNQMCNNAEINLEKPTQTLSEKLNISIPDMSDVKVENSSTLHTVPAVKEAAPAVEEAAPAVETVSAVETVPAMETVPVVETVSEVKTLPVAETVSKVETSSAVKDASVVKDTEIENAHAIETFSAGESASEVEIAATVEINPAAEVTPANENFQNEVTTNVEKPVNNVPPKFSQKSTRKSKTTKPRDNINMNNLNITKSLVTTMEQNIVSLEPIPTVPTLVYATNEIQNNYIYPTCGTIQKTNSLYVPIRPKGTEHKYSKEKPALYLKTVNVPVNALPSATTSQQQQVAEKKPLKNSAYTSTASVKETNSYRKKPTLRSQTCQRQCNKNETAVEAAPAKPEKLPFEELPVVEPTIALPKVEEITSLPPLTQESVTLYANDNSTGMCMDAENMPIISLDDSFCFTNTGFSPLLKFVDKKPDTPESERKSKEPMKPLNETNEKLEPEKSESSSDIITKRTPKSLMKSRAKNHRLSLSTPRRRNNHVRALDFSTPTKMDAFGNKSSGESTRKRSKPICRATLFKSPPVGKTASPKSQKMVKICKPVAKMSPLPKLSSCWEKYTGMGMILGSVSPKNNEPLPMKQIQEKPKLKKSWDADLRSSLALDNSKQLEIYQKHHSKCDNNIKLEKNSLAEDKKNTTVKSFEPSKSVGHEVSSALVNTTTTVVSTSSSVTDIKKKKYAKLKTITTKVTKVISECSELHPIKDLPENIEPPKTSPELIRRHNVLPNMLDLETPRKFDNMLVDIPPTPKLHTPGNSTLSNFPKINDDSTKIQNYIATPEFPPTPCIMYTPNPSDKTLNDGKKDYLAANYYHPDQSNEQEKDIKDDRHESKEMENTSNVPEISQFEVIKENLSKEDAERELKIATVAKDLNMSNSIDINYTSTTTMTSVKETVHMSESRNSINSDSDSSDSDSSSSSNSSRSSYSSNCSTSCNTNSPKSAKKKNKTPHKLHKDAQNDSNHRLIKDSSKLSSVRTLAYSKYEIEHNLLCRENEASPSKVFSTSTKTAEEEHETIQETPAKEDNEEIDMNSTETPCSSKVGIESTNLASKILALESNEHESNTKNIAKPKIVSVKNVTLPMDLRLIPNVSRIESRTYLPTLSPNRKKLQMQLDQKKERLKTALKNTSTHTRAEKPKMLNLMAYKFGKQHKPGIKYNSQVENHENFGSDKEDIAHADIDPKLAHKLKVEQVKRDLFSDEEGSEKRTTRSSSRRIMNAQKVLTPVADEIPKVEPSIEDAQVPGVLECLQLVPANKNEQELDESGVFNISQNGVQAYIKLVYDETNCIKRRKRRFSSSEMNIRLTDEDGKDYVLQPTEYTEMFNYTPKPKRRVVQRKVTTVKRKRRAPAKLGFNSTVNINEALPKPLATSSPAFKEMIAKGGNENELRAIEGSVPNIKEKRSRKRKANMNEEIKKKKQHYGTSYSEDMLHGVDLENFLDKVHGTCDV